MVLTRCSLSPIALLLCGLIFRIGAAANTGTVSVGKLRSDADVALASGDIDLSIKLLDKVIQLEPDNERNFYKRSRANLRKKRYSSVVSDLSSAIRLKPNYKKAIAERAKLRFQMGWCDDAHADLKQLRTLDEKAKELADEPSVLQCKNYLGMIGHFERTKDFQNAKNALDKVIPLADRSSDLLLRRAEVSMHLHQFLDVVVDSGRVIKMEPDSIPALELRGRAYYMLNEPDMAMNHWRQALKHDPEHKSVKGHYRILKKLTKKAKAASDHSASGAYEEAIAEWRLACAVDPAHFAFLAPTLVAISETHLKLSQWDEAADAAQESLNVAKEVSDPQPMQDARIAMGRAKLEGEKYDEALNWFRQAVEADKEDQRAKEELKKAEVAKKRSTEVDHYKVLGVPRNADSKQIKKAYKEKALKFHPDKVAPDLREEAEKEFMKIGGAYEILSDSEMRAKYDAGEDVQGQGGGQQHGGFHPFMHHGQQGGQNFHFHFGR
mmetsp:Transcript_11783/g.15550  ORF Transcript_11783/g.15550 Transcript_11783/m.15550 type:complete len:494 (-) Transcript_11783:660-2141(-)|eukprot:CAMPEP_0185769150 /NCGR_PEP_ID=MMETSP1174-20130828/53404_1 /TAXON_ID=35687 /ORGANISM="Dictyocha speculum, Strain CCMP1381" /LENGTH=493 /DNA_ID=CAMNT_0028454119 /DNA_START=90 /DNA_END=1571 /DNA_ORIENTATION=+